MDNADEIYRGISARIIEGRQKWAAERQESPDTTCTAYNNDCKTVLSVANLPQTCFCSECRGFEKPPTTWMGKAAPDVCTKFCCPCIDKARREQKRADIRSAVSRAVSRFGHLPSKQAQEMTFESYFDNPDWREYESEMAYRAWVYCQGYAEAPGNTPFLTLHGGYGAGKTHLAMAIAQRVALQVVWANCNELFSYLKTRFRLDFDEEVGRIKAAELLVLDDLGANRSTPWETEVLYGIINHRHAERMPTVITTNYNPYGESQLDGRLLSRIGDMRRGRVLHLNIQDNRLMLVRREYREWPER